ncbi:MFS general substrate transporter, partial [Piedraia hortae CBS 480.64]
LDERNGRRYSGFAFSPLRKWSIITAVFLVQISMNFNAAIYAAAVPKMSMDFDIPHSKARLGQMVFLVMYAFGCELWAPWSEDFGRYWVMQISLGLVNIWQIPCALATNFWIVFAARALGGLSSAGGSVTLGIVADMWEPNDQQFATLYVVFSSVAGSVVAPIFGGLMTEYLDWQWVFWISLILGGFTQAVHAIVVQETRNSVRMTMAAKMLRKKGGYKVYSADEAKGTFWQRINWKDTSELMWRPYKFLLTEPIVTSLSLLSGFSDALVFLGLESFGLVLDQWGFGYKEKGFSFVALLIGYFLAAIFFIPIYMKDTKTMKSSKEPMPPERRLWGLLWTAPLLPLGLAGFAGTSYGPPTVPWIAPLLFVLCIGIANTAIYLATIDYMIAAYGEYSASATGGNGFCRDLLAGVSALYATPMYTKIRPGTRLQLVIPTLILFAVAVVGVLPVYYLYWCGAKVRHKSVFASNLEKDR